MTPEQLPCADVGSLRAAIKRISSHRDPEQWAAAKLKLGAALRVKARLMKADERAEAYVEAIEAFEAAVCTYLRCKSSEESKGGKSRLGRCDAEPTTQSRNSEGVDLVLDATRGPMLTDTEPLEIAANIFRSISSSKIRNADVEQWVVNMINLGCTLTLLGKKASCEGDVAKLEEAVETYRSVLAHPSLRAAPYESAVIYCNMAEAVRSIGEVAMPAERLRHLESAMGALVRALCLVAPEGCRELVEVPIGGARDLN